MEFNQAYQMGKTGESEVATWLMKRGASVLPVYDTPEQEHKGPVFYFPNGDAVAAPDMLCWPEGKLPLFIEVKTKNAFSWHRITKQFTTGIDRHHFKQYLKIANITNTPIWLLFLHCGGQAKDSPPSPAGLFGNDIKILEGLIDHEHSNWGKHGMVYWGISALRKIADYPFDD